MINKVLPFYVDKLTTLVEDEKIMYNNDALKDDLFLEIEKIKHIIEDFKNFNIDWYAIKGKKKTVCSALICYVNHLEYSKRLVCDKLGDGVILDFKKIDSEITFAKITKKDIYDNPDLD